MSEFERSLAQHANSGMLSMVMCVGDRLNLFDGLAKVSSQSSPATAKDVADKLKLKERYVKEWLCCMAAGDIIEVDKSGEKFWIPEDRKPLLCDGSANIAYRKLVPLFAPILPKVEETFRLDGPRGVSLDHYADFHDVIEGMSRTMLQKHLISNLIPLTGMIEKLKNEQLEVLDVGCGNGYHLFELAKHFPKSVYTGIDFSATAIEHANQLKEQQGLSNVNFLLMNAQNLLPDWTDKFDLITNYDACHDQTRPDLSLKETYRTLKPGGTFMMLEIDGTGNVYTDKIKFGTTAIFGYAVSVLACLQFGSQSEDALCLGTMWGREKGMKMLHECGFDDVKIVETPFLDMKALYVCHK